MGKSLHAIFAPIRARGSEYYEAFQIYLLHLHNIERMSVESRAGEVRLKAEEALRRCPNYVPTFRHLAQQKRAERPHGQKTDKNAVRIGKTIGREEGGGSRLVPLHEALGLQTMKVVREGSKNRFGQCLLHARDKNRLDTAKYIYDVQEHEASFSADIFDQLEDALEQRITNTFCVYENGKLMELEVDPSLFEAVKALVSLALEADRN